MKILRGTSHWVSPNKIQVGSPRPTVVLLRSSLLKSQMFMLRTSMIHWPVSLTSSQSTVPPPRQLWGEVFMLLCSAARGRLVSPFLAKG